MRCLVAAAVVVACAVQAFAIEKEAVALTTSDGVSISGYYVRGTAQKGPAVVLLHMLGGSKEDWDPIVEKYLGPQTGMGFLAIDLRGHGASTAQGNRELNWRDLSEQDYPAMVKDLEAAVKWLRGREEVDGEKIGIVGASIGANLALNCAAGDAAIKCVVLLSPGLNYKGVKTAQAMQKYGQRPVLLAATREDRPSNTDIVRLDRLAQGKKTTGYYDGNLHGTRMFGNYPIDTLVGRFLNESLK